MSPQRPCDGDLFKKQPPAQLASAVERYVIPLQKGVAAHHCRQASIVGSGVAQPEGMSFPGIRVTGRMVTAMTADDAVPAQDKCTQ